MCAVCIIYHCVKLSVIATQTEEGTFTVAGSQLSSRMLLKVLEVKRLSRNDFLNFI